MGCLNKSTIIVDLLIRGGFRKFKMGDRTLASRTCYFSRNLLKIIQSNPTF